MRAYLREEGEHPPRSYLLRPGVPYVVGRHYEAPIRLSDPTVSRRHACLELDQDLALKVVDLGSVNGTYVMGKALDPGVSAQVLPGQSIAFGDQLLVLEISGDAQGLLRRQAKCRREDAPLLGKEFDLVALVGEGAHSHVWAAWHRPLKRMVAVKVFAPDLHEEPELDLERFHREARVWGNLVGEHVVRMYSASLETTRPFLVLELVHGPTLKELIGDPALTLAKILRLASEVAEALSEVHGYGYVHRDVKPANVLIAPGCRAKLADFGVARDLCQDLTDPGVGLGTLPYASPEQVADPQRVGQSSDFYGLGATLYCMLSGQPPFPRKRGQTFQEQLDEVVNELPLRLSARFPGCPPALEELVHRLLSKDPSRRATSASDLATELRALAGALQLEDSGQYSTLETSIRDYRTWLPKIVVVDDDVDVHNRLSGLLAEDFRLVLTDRIEGLLQEEDCDLALVDVRMPPLSGVDVVNLLRRVTGALCPKVVYFSSLDASDLQIAVEASQADGYLLKSMRGGELISRIREFLGPQPLDCPG